MDPSIKQALYRLLRPLVVMLQRQGIAVGEVIPIVKKVFVDVAAASLVDDDEKPTTSRIAIKVGLTRKDVALIRQSPKVILDPSRYSRVNRVISGWLKDTVYQDSKQRPAVLAEDGEPPSLRSLVSKYSGDMPFNSMKNELLRSGAIELRGQGLWELVMPAYLSINDDEETWRILGDDVSLLIKTIDHNMTSPDDTLFQRKVSYDNVPREYAEQFRRMAAFENQQLLLRLNAWLSDHDRDTNHDVRGTERSRVGVGVYYFEVPPLNNADEEPEQ